MPIATWIHEGTEERIELRRGGTLVRHATWSKGGKGVTVPGKFTKSEADEYARRRGARPVGGSRPIKHRLRVHPSELPPATTVTAAGMILEFAKLCPRANDAFTRGELDRRIAYFADLVAKRQPSGPVPLSVWHDELSTVG